MKPAAEVTVRINDTEKTGHGAHFAVRVDQARYLIRLIRSWRFDDPLPPEPKRTE